VIKNLNKFQKLGTLVFTNYVSVNYSTLIIAETPQVTATPRANIRTCGRYLRLTPFLFLNKNSKKFSFFSEYGGYLFL
jgi:hypothetical protein